MSLFRWLFPAFLLVASHAVYSSVNIGGTRVIFSGAQKEASLPVMNGDKINYLMQTWIEYPGKNSQKVPFVVFPPLFKLSAGGQSAIRIMRNEVTLPDDRESYFWLNVKAIPATARAGSNQLQITVRTRMKLFYRPTSLKPGNNDFFKKVIYRRVKDGVVLSNPTPYYINFYNLSVNGASVPEADMIAPFSDAKFKLSASPDNNRLNVRLSVINDSGVKSATVQIKEQ